MSDGMVTTILNMAFSVACSIALLIQIIQISASYFSFDSTTTVTMETPVKVDIPSLAVCWRYGDIIDLDALRKKNSDIPVFDFTSDETIKNSGWTVQSMATVSEVFDFNPPLEIVFAECIVRFPQSYTANLYTVEECRKHFKVVRFFTMEYICYSVELNAVGQYTASALSMSGMAYQFGFNLSAFKSEQIVFPMIFERGGEPDSSFFFAPELRRFEPTAGARVEVNYFFLTYYMVYNKRLPPPYPSNCSTYDRKSQSECFECCMIQRCLKEFDKFTYTENIYHEDDLNLDKTIINNFNLSDGVFSGRLRALEKNCQAECIQPDCDEKSYLTEIALMGANEESIAFRVNLPKNSNFVIKYQPILLFLDYVTYVLGCLGSWVGFYVLQMNPYNMYLIVIRMIKNKKYKQEVVFKRAVPEIRFGNEARSITCKSDDDIFIRLKVDYLKNSATLLEQELALMRMSNHLN